MSTGRLGIVTIVDNDNVGNRLQNFALQECLESRGWAVETIPNTPGPMRRSLLAARSAHAIRNDGLPTFVRRNAGVLRDRIRTRAEGSSTTGPAGPAPERREAIAQFTRTHIHELDRHFDQVADPAELAARYDHVIVGSDQVWNPGFRQAHEIDFLTFVRPEQRVAYAASFGVPQVPTFLRSRYAQWLGAIPHLSVREHRGAQIVRELIGRDVPVVADPTLLLDPERWKAVARTPLPLQGTRYLATVFLGGPSPDEAAALAAHAEAAGLEVVDLLDPVDPALVAMSPLEFIGALRGADLVATDSFHASVFTLVFERPSITKSRHLTDTRLETLFAHAGIERLPWHVDTLSRTADPNWARVGTRLAAHRQESWRFIEDALGPTAPTTGAP